MKPSRRARRSFGCVAKRAAAPREATNAPPSRRFAARIGRARPPAALCVLAYASRVPASSSACATGRRKPAAAPRAGG
ncbi:hypothetical protein AQ802_22035 [Burkholderia pseudomallei]|nr:hypothetical protein UQ47_06515 [Burkholderia pseudomallei]KYZ82012.1 hypothetical protein PTBPS01_14865 [Burkholderia pseudomallei]OMR37733.1 hypothetical protein AQ725_25170 [Burkholderia pseudomallei]OMS19148.1 hypothetical protein AQ738_18040 [Burkholderia pseudomallei]OMU05431.1 hypothetical protein AQ769_28825 [Burkholderia pseudomallei]